VKVDNNNDNVGDVNLAGVPIKLMDSTGTVVVATTLTDTSGNYIFVGLVPGSYFVVETNLPVAPLDVSDSDGGNLNTIAVSIGGPKPLISNDNNFVDEPTRTISGVVLEDTNNDDIGNTPIPGVTVALIDSAGTIIATTTTNSNGVFVFAGVVPGKYTVVETNVPGFVDVGDTDGGDPNSISVDLSSGNSPPLTFVDERPSSTPTVSSAPSDRTEYHSDVWTQQPTQR
jgi:uncharacterized surface anchored protein